MQIGFCRNWPSVDRMLGRLAPGTSGTPSTWLGDHASKRIEKLLLRLFEDAVVLWSGEDYSRFGDLEQHCTVRFQYFCNRAISTNEDTYGQMAVLYDAAQPTAGMLAGTEDPARMPRPDLTVIVGCTKLQVEAKRLRANGQLPRLYVTEGMQRFLDGRYGSQGIPGIMIGYLLDGSLFTIVRKINLAISNDLHRGSAEHLVSQATSCDKIFAHESRHPSQVRLLHRMIDLR